MTPGPAAWLTGWAIMMAIMMLPSALPMFQLYGTVSGRLAEQNQRVIPRSLFASIYLLVWILFGVPVYLASPHLPHSRIALAALLALAGVYQFTPFKRACLRYCESPLNFLMRRWRNGYLATSKLAVLHAAYCVGCCWALMVILVAVGAMSVAWVVGIALVVAAEKLLPRNWHSASIVGAVLLLMAAGQLLFAL